MSRAAGSACSLGVLALVLAVVTATLARGTADAATGFRERQAVWQRERRAGESGGSGAGGARRRGDCSGSGRAARCCARTRTTGQASPM